MSEIIESTLLSLNKYTFIASIIKEKYIYDRKRILIFLKIDLFSRIILFCYIVTLISDKFFFKEM